MKYLPVFLTLMFVTYGQLAIKSGIAKLGPIPTQTFGDMLNYFLRSVSNVGVVSGLLAAVCGAFAWMAALSRFELSSVYPILSLNFVIVPLFSSIIFGEALNLPKIIGVTVIVLGVFIFSRGL